jgi:hypothetical protein
MERRIFIKIASAAALIGKSGGVATPATVRYEEFLRRSAVTREVIDRFLRGPSWAQFDPDVGYILGNYLMTDGIDGNATISTVQADGSRTSILYKGRKCRINAYGDSFTQCQQVSDGETWEEYLAGHLGEPIPNFGVGGFGVYQAYRRMLREERTDRTAEYLIFYIWGDDHIRSLLRCRRSLTYKSGDDRGGAMFQGIFWSNVEMDLDTGRFVEKEGLIRTPAALYHMTDPQFMVAHLKDDLALQLYAFKSGYIEELDQEQVGKLAARLDYPWDWSQQSTRARQVRELLDRYSLRATQYILNKAREFSRQNGKKLLVVLFDPYRAPKDMLEAGKRYDQIIVDYLTQEKFNYFDMNEVHLRDFKKYNLSFDEYKKLYFLPHYNPSLLSQK